MVVLVLSAENTLLGAPPAASAALTAASSVFPYATTFSGNFWFHASFNKSLLSTSRQSFRSAPWKLVSSAPSYKPP